MFIVTDYAALTVCEKSSNIIEWRYEKPNNAAVSGVIVQYFWPALSDNRFWNSNFGLLFECPLKTGLTVFNFWRKMQLVVLGCVSWRLILAFWNALKPFSVSGLHPWPYTGRSTPDHCKSVYSIKCLRNAPGCASQEDSGQPKHQLIQVRVFTVHRKIDWVLSYPLCTRRRLWSDRADF